MDPPNTLIQLFGGCSPAGPLPSRKMYRSRAAEPRGALSASWNHACSDEVWFGTRSTITEIPTSLASAINCLASASVPKSGLMSV